MARNSIAPGGYIGGEPPRRPMFNQLSGVWKLDDVLERQKNNSWANALGVEDVFSTWLYTGNGSTQTITNGIDLSGKGGLVWLKGRTTATNHVLQDSAAGWNKVRASNLTSADNTATYVDPLSNGFTWYGGNWGDSGIGLASWTFRKAAKFFDVVTYTGNGASQTIAHNLGSVPGCIIVKRTNASSDWAVYHRSLATNEWLLLNDTSAKVRNGNIWNNTAPTSTVFSVGSDGTSNFNGQPYVAYLFAHDAGGFGDSGNDSVVSCGTFDASATVTLGWEPQWLLIKNSGGVADWNIVDNMRGWPINGNANRLQPNTSDSEATLSTARITATGFTYNAGDSNTYIYIAIRRGPMKTPTDATKVFGLSARSGTGANATVAGGQIADAVIIKNRGSAVLPLWGTRLLNRGYLTSSATTGETTADSTVLQSNPWDVMDGVKIGTTSTITNASSNTFINYLLRRSPGFMDVVAYDGNGVTNRTVSHNLGVKPLLIFIKRRGATAWRIYTDQIDGSLDYLQFDNTAKQDSTQSVATSTVFYVSDATDDNGSGTSYIAHLFGSLSGVSKVGVYTGTGTTLSVDCGFTNGARFVMIKRTDTTGDWYVWDTARGIVSADDPYFLMNSTAAEVTNTDYIDPVSSGFQISSTAPAAINANGGSYIFLAIA